MLGFTEQAVEECSCFHRQLTERTGCGHALHHDLAEAIIRGLGTQDPITQRAIRAAVRRRLAGGRPHGYHGS